LVENTPFEETEMFATADARRFSRFATWAILMIGSDI
jgi:hypothetical protein